VKISAVIPTCKKQWDEGMTFRSLPNLSRKPDEILVVMDAKEEKTEEHFLAGIPVRVIHTHQRGAAAKRNLGVRESGGKAILFVDDDVEFRPCTLAALEKTLESDLRISGVGAFIENQVFQEPGLYSRTVYQLAGGWGIRDFAGRCFGPLINLYPRPWAGDVIFQESEWLNSTCTLYRREALPQPVFEAWFTGYSFMEDLALSRKVRKKWKIGMARDARVVHHTRPAPYKQDVARLQQMGLENKHYILQEVEDWPTAKAALALTWLEILLLPATFKDVIKNPWHLKKALGTCRGLAKVWTRSLKRAE
jgi:glycosyltransferase involved in cell wall biosynthesis